MSQSQVALQLLELNPQNFFRQVKHVASSSALRLHPQLPHISMCISSVWYFFFEICFIATCLWLCKQYHGSPNSVKTIRNYRIEETNMESARNTTLHRVITQAIENYKLKHGLPYKEIANKCGISPSQFSEILRKKSRLTAEQVEKICMGLGTTLQEIVSSDVIEGGLKPRLRGLGEEEYEVLAMAVDILQSERHGQTLKEVIQVIHNVMTQMERDDG